MKKKEKIIINSISELLKYKDIDDISMEDIAKNANISVGSIYTYYKSKKDLVASLFDNYDVILNENLDVIIKDTTKKGIDKLSAILSFVLSTFEQNNCIAKLYFSGEIGLKDTLAKKLQPIKIKEIIHNCFLEEFGDDIKPYAYELTLVFHGICISFISELYLKNILKNNERKIIDNLPEKITKKIISNIKIIANQLLEEKDEPLITDNNNSCDDNTINVIKTEILRFIDEIETYINNSYMAIEDKNRLIALLGFIRTVLQEKEPRLFLIVPLIKEFSDFKELLAYTDKIEFILRKINK